MRTHWTSQFSFVLATVGSAVGLGNVWKFPYIAGVNGGGAFVLMYLICIIVVGIPIFIAELYIGQKSQTNCYDAFSLSFKKKTAFNFVGLLGIISSFLIVSFYSVIGGWILEYEYLALTFSFSENIDVANHLSQLFQNPVRLIILHLIFILISGYIVSEGVSRGLERWNRILMPGLFLILFGLLLYVLTLSGFKNSLYFLFSPDFSKITSKSLLEAVGHSFFTLSLGMGAIITYGSYLNTKTNLVKMSFIVAGLDTLVALLSGIVIFSIVFSHGLPAEAGPSLMFKTLPVLFSKMTGGSILAIFFFLLVLFAALTSAVSMIEVIVAFFYDKTKISRKKITWLITMFAFVLGIPSVLSFNVFPKFIGNNSFFDVLDFVTSNLFLPIGAIFISIFFGFYLKPVKEFHPVLFLFTRYISPICVMMILMNKLINSF